MNKVQNSNVIKFIAFFLVALVLICTFGFTADGWEFGKRGEPVDPQNNLQNKPPEQLNDQTSAEEKNDDDDKKEDAPKFYNKITGLETTELLSKKRHLAFLMETGSPLYGASFADVVLEFPVDNSKTRIVCLTNQYEQISKIGSLAATRGYISDIICAFDSIAVSLGFDDNASTKLKTALDLSLSPAYKYSEFEKFTYTNGELISNAINSSGYDGFTNDNFKLPFEFTDIGSQTQKSPSHFKRIDINTCQNEKVSLVYDIESHLYSYLRSSITQADPLNENDIAFSNCFVLFADSVTYEDSNGAQMDLKTNTSGSGYYFTEGTAFEILWEMSDDGVLSMTEKDGDVLKINRGKSYISFVKSSQSDKIILS